MQAHASRIAAILHSVASSATCIYNYRMSFLFDKRTKKAINMVWAVVAVLVIIGMVVFFAPGLVTILG